MTSLMAWIGVDSRGPSSIYLASDSRISWQGTKEWNYGRKLFASNTYPDILGYFGDVLFPSQVLGQIVDLIDKNLLLNETDEPRIRFRKISELVTKSFGEYPPELLSLE